jgi:hypothetical protein
MTGQPGEPAATGRPAAAPGTAMTGRGPTRGPGTAPTTSGANTNTHTPAGKRSMRAAVLWGLVFGALQAASPLAFWWLEPSTVLALSLSLIAAVYIGFAVADGRPKVIAVESTIAGAFVVLAATAVTATAWILVLGFTAHGVKDAWQERSHYVANTRWWPPFCAAVDWLVAGILVIEITAGVHFH